MAWDDFGQSWLGVIANPAGYLLQRKSPANAANDYLGSNPISNVLTGLETELQYKEDRQRWVDACASKLKSDDVGKSKANSEKACAKAWDEDGTAQSILEQIQNSEAYKKDQAERTLQTRAKIFFFIAIAGAVILLAFFVFKSKTLIKK